MNTPKWQCVLSNVLTSAWVLSCSAMFLAAAYWLLTH